MTRLSCMIVLAVATADAGLADTYFGLDHTAAGDAELTGLPDGGVGIRNLGHTGLDGVDVGIPGGWDTTRFVEWQAEFDGAGFIPGMTMTIRGVGLDGSGIPSVACFSVLDLSPGNERLLCDFSAVAPVSIGARYYAGGVLVAEESGLSPTFAPIGGFPPVITEPCGSVHFNPVTQQWTLDGCLGLDRTIGGTPLPACDHWEIFTEGASVSYLELMAVEVRTTNTAEIDIVHATLTATPIPSGCPGDADGDRDVDFDDLNAVLSSWGSAGPAGDVFPNAAPNGQVDFDDLNDVLANWDMACP